MIAAEIERGTLRRGTMLPPERTMCEQLGVSRVTLRAGHSATLAEQRLLVASHGRGWFVSDSLLGEPPNVLQSFSELAAARGLNATSRVQLAHVREASLQEADELEIGPGAPLFEMRRVRLLDGLPVADRPRPAAPRRLSRSARRRLRAGLALQTLEQHGVRPRPCDFSVQAVAAEPEHAEQLNVATSALRCCSRPARLSTPAGPSDRAEPCPLHRRALPLPRLALPPANQARRDAQRGRIDPNHDDRVLGRRFRRRCRQARCTHRRRCSEPRRRSARRVAGGAPLAGVRRHQSAASVGHQRDSPKRGGTLRAGVTSGSSEDTLDAHSG